MRTRRRRVLFALTAMLFVSAREQPPPVHAFASGPPGTFTDVSEQLGVVVTPIGGRDDWGHGASFHDFNDDGYLDLYVVLGLGQPNALFNYTVPEGEDLPHSFSEVAPLAGCADVLDGRGVAWADYDNDGDADFFLSNHLGSNRLYRNDGTGKFTDVAAVAGLAYTGRCHSAAWADYDNDGHLDLFVCNYGTRLQAYPNLLYHNNGDGTFAEVASTAGVADPNKPALGCVWIDYDNDSDLDLYIAYDKYTRNTMYGNQGNGTFVDVSRASNTGLLMNGMGIAVGDYDGDGFLDMYITNTEEGNELLRNNGNGIFTGVAALLGLSVNRIGWGTAFFDYDNDGDEDLYVVNWAPSAGNIAGANVFFRNEGGTFADVTSALGVANPAPGYGLTVGDYNGDGAVDMFVNNQSEGGTVPSVLYENVPTGNRWLKIRTVGTASNRDGVGAKVRVVVGGHSQLKDVRSGSSYLSQTSPELHFGLAGAAGVTRIEITWPSGTVDVFNDIGVNQYVVATEGTSLHAAVFIPSFRASVKGRAVELSWGVRTTGVVDGYRVYRRESGGASPAEEVRLGGDLLDPEIRSYLDTEVEAGKTYEYRLGVVLEDGAETLSKRVRATTPTLATALAGNLPNPFHPATLIRFTLAAESRVALDVFDVQGKHVASLLDEIRPAGPNEAQWNGARADGGRAGSGVYFYRLRTGSQTFVRKMVLVR